MIIADLEKKYRNHTPTVLGVTDHYALLVPLVEWAGDTYLVFEVRADSMRRQPGEVCFPGGRMESGETPTVCALRETQEELGIPSSAIEPIALLDQVYHQSGQLLHPVLARVDAGAVLNLTLNPHEVKGTFTVPLSFFLENPPKIYQYALKPEVGADFPYALIDRPEGYDWKGGVVEVPIYRYKDYAIWGMTARIIHALVEG